MRKFRITQSCQEYYLIEAEDEDGAFDKLYSGDIEPDSYGDIRIDNVEELFGGKKCDECHQKV